MLNDVKRKVVRAAERPDGDREQHRQVETRIMQQDGRDGDETENDEEQAFAVEKCRTFDIAHGVHRRPDQAVPRADPARRAARLRYSMLPTR
jgi:hypothetical protein